MRMKGGAMPTKSQGFTIIETLIVLAVTSFMFVIATIYISGRQNRVLFMDSAEDVRAKIQQTINETSTGYYPSMNDTRCVVSGNVLTVTKQANIQQGTNGDCIFVGKVMVFGFGTDTLESYTTHTVLGKRTQSNGQITNSLTTADASVLHPTASIASGQKRNWPDGSVRKNLLNGMSFSGGTQGSTSIIGFGIVASGWGHVAYSNGVLESGVVQPALIAIPYQVGLEALGSNAEIAEYINGKMVGGTLQSNPAEGVKLCFASGSTNQSALISIGVNNRTAAVEMQIKEGKTC